jgi:hypothetical protein
MGDRPNASNGKRHVFWGTLRLCPSCGRCLCFGCHPDGPCVDDRDEEREDFAFLPQVAAPAS